MKILYIHNKYAAKSGEEHASAEIVAQLESNGHEVRWFTRSSEEISGISTKIKAFFTGIYNPFAARKLAVMLDEYRPDIVQVQNLYPFLSPAIFKPLRKRNVPVVMRCPNYRLFCPTGLCIDPQGKVCEDCWSGSHEWNCIKKNCMSSRFKSLGYALRNCSARRTKAILNGVDIFVVQSDFQLHKFTSMGIAPERIAVVPGILPQLKEKHAPLGKNVIFVGRVSAEKGIYEFLEAARSLPDIPFKVVGKLDSAFIMPHNVTPNVEFVGFKSGEDLDNAYLQARIVVVPSKWYEGFPNILLHAMFLHRPCITTNIGAMQSIIDNGTDGVLVAPGSSEVLKDAIYSLYYDIDLCNTMGENGYKKATTKYSREAIYNAIIDSYNKAINNHI